MSGLLLLLTLIATAPVSGAAQSVTVRLNWVDAPPRSAAVTLQARNATRLAESVETALTGSEASLPLSPGQWFVTASVPGYWSEPTLVSVTDAPAAATVALYRAARLKGQVTTPSRAKTRTVDVYFNPTQTLSGRPRGSTSCPVSDGRLDCELPTGLYDLAFRIPGHASLYRWDVDLRAKPSLDVGRLAFRVGATVSGRVEMSGGGRADTLERVEVTLRNASGGLRNDNERGRESVTRLVTRPNARGFFTFDVLPGAYIISAASPGLVSDEREITVIEGREAVLKDPLTLERLLTLVVNVQLPTEGAKQPWKLAVRRYDAEGQPSPERVVSVPPDGVCRFEGQLPGSYDAELRIGESVWAAHSGFLERDTTIDLPVIVMQVRGSIRLGDDPLPGRVVFRSAEKRYRIPVQSRADGTFLVFLPEVPADRWERIDIQSDAPWVKRELHDVPLERHEDGVATIDLRLPALRLEGVVVDENDRRVGGGVISISAPDGFRQYKMSDGTFAIEGLAPGRYALTAATRERETADPLFVEISSDGDGPPNVVVKVMPVSTIRGSVVSAAGPVVGASVFIGMPNDVHQVVGTIPVDTTGSFEFRLPQQTRDVLVALIAPGFSFRMMRLPVTTSKLELAVDQNGGALTIDGRVGATAEPYRPYVLHNGALLSANTVGYLSRARFLANSNERVHFEIASAEEGPYTLCLLSPAEERSIQLGARLPDSRCVTGVLARHGALTLRAVEIEQQ